MISKILALTLLLIISSTSHAIQVYTDGDVETSSVVSGFYNCGDSFDGYVSKPTEGLCVVKRYCINEEGDKKTNCEKWNKSYSYSEYLNHRAGREVEIDKIVWKTDGEARVVLFYKESPQKVQVESDFINWNPSGTSLMPVFVLMLIMLSFGFAGERRS